MAYRPRAVFRRLALRNYCIANNIYWEFCDAMETHKTEHGVEYVNGEKAESFIAEMVPMFSPYVYDWSEGKEIVPSVAEFREKLGLNRITTTA